MLAGLSGWHFIIIAGVVVLLFGATKLPVFSKSLGQSIKIFRKEITDVKHDIEDDRRQAKGPSATEAEPVYSTTEPAAGAQRASGTASATPGSSDR